MNTKMSPEEKFIVRILGGNDYDKCEALLTMRNKVFKIVDSCGNAFTDEELESVTDLVIEHCLGEGYITWDEAKQTYVRNSDGTPIADL